MKKFYSLLSAMIIANICFSQIVITEISYNPPEAGTDSTEYIEFYNNSLSSVNMTNYSITSGVVFTFPTASIAPGEYIVVAVDTTAVRNRFLGNSYQLFEWTSGGLSNGGEPIALKDNLGVLIDSVRYDDVAPWPTSPDSNGPSLVLCDPNSDNTDGSNWSASASQVPSLIVNTNPVFGSPGLSDTACIVTAAVSISSTNVSCNGLSDGSATATPTSGTAPFTYLWSNSATTPTITNVTAGTYTVTLTDNSSTTATATTTITEPTAINISFSKTDVICFGINTGSIITTVTGGSSPYNYLWSTTQTIQNLNNLSSGKYILTVTDNIGCTQVDSVDIFERPAFTYTISSTNNICPFDSLATVSATSFAGGTPPYNYVWSNGANGSGTSSNLTNLKSGTYTITITDAFGCTTVDSVVITEPTINLSFTTVGPSCNGLSDGAASAIISGGLVPYTYNWSTSDITALAPNLLAGTYTITVTDANNCATVDSVVVSQPAVLSASINTVSNVSCNGLSNGGATATAGGGTPPYTFDWPGQPNSSILFGVGAGIYTLTVTDANGCSDTDNITISEPATLIASVNTVSDVTCNGLSNGGATATAGGGTPPYTFDWPGQPNSSILFGVGAGIYTLTVTDANGCSDTDLITIAEPAPLIVMTVVDSNSSGFGVPDGGATANAMGGTAPYAYAWSNAATSASITGLLAGTYTVTVTDNNGCTGTSSVIISQPNALNVSFTTVNVSCFGSTDGSISAAPIGGVSPYTYAWSNSTNTQIIANLAAGTYTLTLTDANNIVEIDSVVITEPTLLTASTTLDSNASCFISADGGATATGAGGTAPYTYNWSNSAATPAVTGLGVGIYTVTITDNNGCTATDLAIINSNDNTPPTAIAQNISVYLNPSGQVTVNPADLDNGSNDNCSIANLQVLNGSFACGDVGPNTSRLIAIDGDGNRDTATAIVTVIDTIGPTVLTQDITVFLDSNRTITLDSNAVDNASSDACGIQLISLDRTSFNCTDVGANTVTMYVFDVNNNFDSATAIVTIADTVGAQLVNSIDQACGSYTWTQNNQTYTSSGLYNDTSRNIFGCDSIIYVLDLTINQATAATDTQIACDSLVWIDGITYFSDNNTASFTLTNAAGCDSVVTLDLTVNSASASSESASACFSYTWPQNSQTYTSSGMYTDVIQNSQGCDSVITLDLEIRPLSLNVVNIGDSLFAFENHPDASYQWFDCRGDSIIPGATSRGLRPDTTGAYKVIISNGLCSDTSACQDVIVIGLDDRAINEEGLNIYPNPTSNDFFFEIERFGEDDQLFVFDMKGKTVHQQRVVQLQEKIETDGWEAGIYFIRYNGVMKKLVLTR